MRNFRKQIILLCVSIFQLINVNAQSPLVKSWDYRFGSSSTDYFFQICATTDNNLVMAGYSAGPADGDKTQPSQGDVDYWIVKTDMSGNKIWDRRFGGNNFDVLESMDATWDGGVIIGGYTISDSSGDVTHTPRGVIDYWIVRVDAAGNKVWDKRYGGNDGNILSCIKTTADHHFFIGGYSSSNNSFDKTEDTRGSYDYWVLKLDSAGNKLWDKTYGGNQEDRMFALVATNDNGIMACGYSRSGISGEKSQPQIALLDYWILKADSAGNKQWDKTFGGNDDDLSNCILQLSNGDYLIGGQSYSDSGFDKSADSYGNSDFWIVKTDSTGTKIWDKGLGASSGEELINMLTTVDGNIILSGDSYSPMGFDKSENNLGTEQAWVIKIDTSGNKMWDKTIFTTGHDESGYTLSLNNGCYIIANWTNSGVGGYKTQDNRDSTNITYDYWMAEWCDSTETTGIQEALSLGQINVYPNPCNSVLTIDTDQQQYQAKLFNYMGQVVLEKYLSGQTETNTIEVDAFSSGVYFLELMNIQHRYISKVIISH